MTVRPVHAAVSTPRGDWRVWHDHGRTFSSFLPYPTQFTSVERARRRHALRVRLIRSGALDV